MKYKLAICIALTSLMLEAVKIIRTGRKDFFDGVSITAAVIAILVSTSELIRY